MYIKPSVIPASATLPSIRPQSVSQLTSEGEASKVGLPLSGEVRAQSATLAQQLPAAIAELAELTAEDRLVLAVVAKFADARGIDAAEVEKLAHDLAAHRGASRPETAGHAVLQLPLFSQRDEALARAVTVSLAARDTLLDHDFVRALLDPVQRPAHAVDFEFLRRVVLALSVPRTTPGADASAQLALRAARADLAQLFNALAVRAAELPAPSPQRIQLGIELLRARVLASVRPSLVGLEHGADLPRATGATSAGQSRDAARLSPADRALLGLLYAAASERGPDLEAVDEVARALVALRRAEHAQASQPLRASDVQPTAEDGPAPASAYPAAAGARTAPDARFAPGSLRPDAALRARTETNASAAPHPAAFAAGQHAGAVARPSGAPPEDNALYDVAARPYGDAAQLAAKAAGVYRSLAPPPPLATDEAAYTAAELAAHATAQALIAARDPAATAHEQQLDLARALGMSGLVRDAQAQLRASRSRAASGRRRTIQAIGAAAATGPEAEADDPFLDAAPRRRRARWQLLLQRRRRARAQRG